MVVPKNSPTKERVLKLMSDKDKLEARINEYGAVLSVNGNVGMNEPLVDAEGFPRNDIDVYQVRQARQQIICLQNDHKELMKQIEQEIHKLHAESASEESDLSNRTAVMELQEDGGNSESTQNALPLTVIAKINFVSFGSPAEEAGLCVGDEIIEFGTINSSNFGNDLNEIGNVVKHMVNQRIPLKIQRNRQLLEMVLIPKTWSGRGLLGCNIILPENVER